MPPDLTRVEEFIRYLRDRGFTGPEESEGNKFMIRGEDVIYVPNPHITREYLETILGSLRLDEE